MTVRPVSNFTPRQVTLMTARALRLLAKPCDGGWGCEHDSNCSHAQARGVIDNLRFPMFIVQGPEL